MEAHFQTLRTIFDIAKHDPKPQTYLCRPREIILRQFLDWTIVQHHLALLEVEELVITKQLDTLVISITEKGINKLKEQGVAV
jgi:predicted transcriptional regulator